MAVEDVVAERQRDRRLANEITAYQERLREPFGTLLYRVVDLQAEMAAIAGAAAGIRGCRDGVEISRISRIPASMSVDSG